MNHPLVRAQRVVETRFRLLGQKLNDELGYRDQRLLFKKRSMRQGPTTWVLSNQKNEATGVVLPQGSVAELAPARNDESVLYFNYNEQWQSARARDHIEFVSSNLRFVIAGVEAMPDLQFRLEWADAKTEGSAVAYPGLGAAHPHWQFDVDYGWIGRDSIHALAHSAEDATIEVELEPGIEEVDLTATADAAVEPTSARISATLAGFHHIHLPARAMWHEFECTMPEVALPQQHTPQSEVEIDRWLISALRYLKHEFEIYL